MLKINGMSKINNMTKSELEQLWKSQTDSTHTAFNNEELFYDDEIVKGAYRLISIPIMTYWCWDDMRWKPEEVTVTRFPSLDEMKNFLKVVRPYILYYTSSYTENSSSPLMPSKQMFAFYGIVGKEWIKTEIEKTCD